MTAVAGDSGNTRVGTIVFLNGASSSGKTSLARALQALADRPWFWVTTDHFWPMMPPTFDPDDEIPLRKATAEAFLRSLLLLSRAGWDVVADAVVIHPAFRELCRDLLGTAPAHFVAVRCAADELERRERARGDRSPGLARQQIERIHSDMAYDFEVDTTEASPEQCARLVLEYLAARRSPSAFLHLRGAG